MPKKNKLILVVLIAFFVIIPFLSGLIHFYADWLFFI